MPSSVVDYEGAAEDGKDNDKVAAAMAQSFSPEENEAFKDIQRDAANFSDYEKQFQEILMSLENDDILSSFRDEYSSLHHSFLKSYEGENRLLRKCLDLQSDIYTAVAKAQAAEELSLEDHQTIESLTAEVERTRKKVSNTREKEAQLRERTEKLKKELVELDKLVREPVEAAVQEAALQSLLRVHETVLKEKENQEYRVSTLQYDIAAAGRRLVKLRSSKTANDAEVRAIREAIESKQQEADSTLCAKRAREEELRAAREDLARWNAILNEKQLRMEKLREDGVKHQADTRRVTAETEQLTEVYQSLCRQIQHTSNALQECSEENDVLQRRVREGMAALQVQQNEVVNAHKQYLKESKLAEALHRRNVVAEQRRAEAEQARDELQGEVSGKEDEFKSLQNVAAMEAKELAAVHRELDLLHQSHLTAEGVTQRNAMWLSEKQSQLRHAEHALSATEEHSQRQKEAIFKASRECLAYEEQMKRYGQQCSTMLGEVQACDVQIAETQASIAELEVRLRHQQEMLDSVIQARNAYAKHHSDLRHDLAEMNKSFQLILVQIHQIKDDILHKERSIVAEEATIANLQRQRKELEVQILNLQRRVEKKYRIVDAFNGELRALSDVLADAGDEVARQRRRCRDVLHERDVLSTQAVSRSKELSTLYEKVHTQQALLQRSEGMYRDRVRHIDQLEYQTAKLAQQLRQMKDFVSRIPELRLLVNNATRELNRERAKVAALLNTCAHPLNLHPDNELAWSEPATFALAERTRALQRELGQRRQLLSETEKRIAETEQRYMKAKASVAQQPGPEVAEQLTTYQANLVKKQAQMQQMQESLRYFREQTESYRSRHDELKDQLNAMAKMYAAKRVAEEEAAAEGGRAHGGGRRRVERETVYHSTGGGEEEEDEDEDEEGALDKPLVYAGFVAPPMNAEV